MGTDASAAKGMVTRMGGLGEIRYIDVADPWMQERVVEKEIKVDQDCKTTALMR